MLTCYGAAVRLYYVDSINVKVFYSLMATKWNGHKLTPNFKSGPAWASPITHKLMGLTGVKPTQIQKDSMFK